MNQNDSGNPRFGHLRALLSDKRSEERFRAIVLGAAFLLTVLAFAVFGAAGQASSMEGFESGKVADREVLAERDVVYVDQEATAIRIEAEKRLVPAVFIVDDAATKAAKQSFEKFRAGFLSRFAEGSSSEELLSRLASDFPSLAKSGLPERLAEYPVPANVFIQARILLDRVLGAGVVALPDEGLGAYNPEIIEIRRWDDGPLVYEQVPVDRLATARTATRAALEAGRSLKLTPTLTSLAADLAGAFLRENASFDPTLSERRLEAAMAAVEPVMRRIAKGDRVIRKGFIVTGEDLVRLAALRKSGARFDMLFLLGGILLLSAIFWGSYLLLKREGKSSLFGRPAFVLIVGVASAYFCLATAAATFLPESAPGLYAVFMPTALLSILMGILFTERFAIIYTLSLAFGLLVATGLDASSFALALSSGIGGVLMVRKAEKRIDLVRAGTLLSVLQFLVGLALGAISGNGPAGALVLGFWAAINGFFCAVLTLGFLPVLEQALNSATVFRLQELSDLNAPALKRLLSVAPGTYSHSITVAHLAESACREIGADALLSRVGAYYHDIGKTEQPEYFIENQSGYNKHDDINPRLSATVLRSHVKFGLERADALRLPESVRAIIAEHHGTSLITYFYAQAQKDSTETSTEDFSYPGPAPSSKEAAVVMLADCVEAASRTLKRPSMVKLEQFVKEMIMDKFDHGQLARSELTFRDLGIILNTFVRILAGHFHSRIEYPKAREQQK